MAFRDLHTQLQDLRELDWTERRSSSGTGGMLLKARRQTGANLWFYKLSSYDPYRGVYGHECVNELVASRLMEHLGMDHLRYELVHALVSIDGQETETWLNRSKNFRKTGESKLGLDTFYELKREAGEAPLAFCERMGWKDAIDRIMALDFLIANRDRHGANIEVLVDRAGAIRLAPVFDCGLSFVFSSFGDDKRIRAFDPLDDVPANNFLGTRSLEANLAFVNPDNIAGWSIDENACRELTRGLEQVVSQDHIAKIEEIVLRRWERLEELRDR